MMKRYTVGVPVSIGAVVLAVACSPDAATMPESESSTVVERGIALDLIPPGQDIPFIPLAASATCAVGGKGQQVVLPQGYVYTTIASEGPGFTDLSDMNTLN